MGGGGGAISRPDGGQPLRYAVPLRHHRPGHRQVEPPAGGPGAPTGGEAPPAGGRSAVKKKSPLRVLTQRGPYQCASKTVSRVLYLTVIYLGALLPVRSSHPGSGRASLYAPIPVLLRIEFTAMSSLQSSSELLPHFSTLTTKCGGISLLHFS